MIKFLKNKSLKKFNTFKLNIKAKKIVLAKKLSDIYKAWLLSKYEKISFLILGKGSNVLFLNDYHGIVVINKLKGITINEDKNFWYLHIKSGENWHKLVVFCMKNGFFGLENLALIPGTVGSALIQNIGAYGVEFEQLCHYVDILNCNNNKIIRIKSKKYYFEYRNSIFKCCYLKGFIVIAVGIIIKKKWKPNISYLNNTKINISTPQKIFKNICNIRKNILPDYKLIGNAGSFFKNPILNINTINMILKKNHDIKTYKYFDKYKISAGNLIEKCHLKGYSIGDAQVYKKHALIIINRKNATWKNIFLLAYYVYICVEKKFHINLEPEVQFIFSKKKNY